MKKSWLHLAMSKRPFFILIGILLVAAVLRFYQLTTIPPSLEWDEVATGYDAYSILKTGRDQYGNFLPLTIRSLDDYKPPLYTYLTVASIAVFGWNDFAVRFPAAFLGVLAILTTYGMVQILFSNSKLALLATLFLAISPWHVNFSRLALETNSTIFFTTAAVWAFLLGLKKSWFLPISAILFGLNLFLYHNARVFVPLLGLTLLILYFKELTKHKIALVISLVIICIFLIRLIPIATSIEGQMRFNGTSIFSTATPLEIDEAKKMYAGWRVIDNQNGLSLYGTLFHNQYVLFGLRLFHNYLTHFDPNFWVFTNDYPRHHVPEMGVIYFVDLPLFFIGLYFLIRNGNKKALVLFAAWMFFAPIAAAVTRDVPHALRVELMLPMFQIAIAFGVVGLLNLLKSKKNWRSFLILTLASFYFLNVSFFLHKFLFHYGRETSKYWQYGRREAALFTDSIKENYAKVIVSTKLEQPHMFFLYYLKYDPAKYLQEGGTASGGWAEDRNKFDKYQFKPISYGEMSDGNTLFVGLSSEFPPSSQILKKIYYLSGEEAIWVVAG